MRAFRFAILLVAVVPCFASGCENVLGVRDLKPDQDAASSDASIDSQISEDASSDTAANTSKDSPTGELDAGADVSVEADADADAGDATDALASDAADAADAASETAVDGTVWWGLASEPGGYESLSAVIVPGEVTPEHDAVSFNFSFSFHPDVPPHPSVGNAWEAPYISLRWAAPPEDASPAPPAITAALHVPQALTDAIELVDGADAGATCSFSWPHVFPCVGAFDLFGGYRLAEVAFEWVPYRRYRYIIARVEPSGPMDASSSSWWEASITDLATDEAVRIARFRLKADRGGLQPISRTQVISFPYCAYPPPPSISAYAPRGERAGPARSAAPFFQEATCVAAGDDR